MSGQSVKVIASAAALFLAVGCLAELPFSDESGEVPSTTEPLAEESNEDTGTLAAMGADGNLYLATLDDTPVALTTDGNLTSRSEGVVNGSPSWSPDGWLAFVRTEATRRAQTMTVLAFPPGDTQNPIEVEQQASAYAYGYWAPTPCSMTDPCGVFSFLTSDSEGINFNTAEVTTGGARSEIFEQSNQHYFSWAPDGERMLWFRDQMDLTIHNIYDHTTETEFDHIEPGTFQAPAWSPMDDRLLIAQQIGGQNQLTILDGDTVTEIGPTLPHNIAFAWSPNGSQIALGGNNYPMESFYIVDAETGDAAAFDELTEVAAFFWAPDGKRIAVLTIAPEEAPVIRANAGQRARTGQQGAPHAVFQWQFVDVDSGIVERGPAFVPTFDHLYFVQFFEQFGQSHRIWSPDSRYITYAERVLEENPRIRVYNAADPGSEPVTVMNGTFAVFSFK